MLGACDGRNPQSVHHYHYSRQLSTSGALRSWKPTVEGFELSPSLLTNMHHRRTLSHCERHHQAQLEDFHEGQVLDRGLLSEVARSGACFRKLGNLVIFMAVALWGCSTHTWEPGPASVKTARQDFIASPDTGVFRLEQQTEGDRLILQLAPATCIARYSEQDIVTETEYKKSTFVGGPGLAIGGVAMAGLGTAVFLSAKKFPNSCAPDDEDCMSKDDAQGVSAVAWGLGAAGIIVGLYRAFKAPEIEGTRDVLVGAPRVIDQTAPCSASTSGQLAWLRLSNGAAARATSDGAGIMSFALNGDEIPVGTTGELSANGQRFVVDLSSIARGGWHPSPPQGPNNAPDSGECIVPENDDAKMALAICSVLLTKLADKGVEWASDEVSERFADAMNLSANNWPRQVLGSLFRKFGEQATAEARETLARQACCVLLRQLVWR